MGVGFPHHPNASSALGAPREFLWNECRNLSGQATPPVASASGLCTMVFLPRRSTSSLLLLCHLAVSPGPPRPLRTAKRGWCDEDSSRDDEEVDPWPPWHEVQATIEAFELGNATPSDPAAAAQAPAAGKLAPSPIWGAPPHGHTPPSRRRRCPRDATRAGNAASLYAAIARGIETW